MNSYHIFYFPFAWDDAKTADATAVDARLFSEQTDPEKISINPHSNWLRNPGPLDETEKEHLYNEQNYYYPFVHPVLYDTEKKDSILHHYERKEPQRGGVTYVIAVRDKKTYRLKVDAIDLNLYCTGIGMLTFFLNNEDENQKAPDDILVINQRGRRIFPPFFADIEGKGETAEFLALEGLNGAPERFREDFSGYKNHRKTWEPACFIRNLIADLSEDLVVKAVVDDRMFVNCWYSNDELAHRFQNDDAELSDFFKDDFWYKYLFIDQSAPTCKNDDMKKNLLERQTYTRWQKDGSIYGISRYSFVLLSNTKWFPENILAVHMRTIYARMVELAIIQRASLLKFSGEVTRVSKLSDSNKKDRDLMIQKISSLYKSYIRFINQIYFREVSAQEQGIELYKLLSKTLETDSHIKDLDGEIEELHRYVALLDDQKRSRNAEKLNMIAAIFLPATLIAGLFGMNYGDYSGHVVGSFWNQLLWVVGVPVVGYGIMHLLNRRR
jgi:Mg2+ and Co2+ transporter CorA